MLRPYTLGQRYGFGLSEEFRAAAQARLETRVAAFIERRGKRIAAVRAELSQVAEELEQQPGSRLVWKDGESDAVRIIRMRTAVRNAERSNELRKRADALTKKQKAFDQQLKNYTEKQCRRANERFAQFLLGAAEGLAPERRGDQFTDRQFTSQVYQNYLKEETAV